MKTLHALFFSSIVLGLGALTVGCGGEDELPASVDGGKDAVANVDSGPVDAGPNADANDGGPQEFTDFVKQLILTQTSDKTLPTTTEDKVFVDSHDPKAFPPAFFP